MGAKYKYKHEAEWKSDRDVSGMSVLNHQKNSSVWQRKLNQVNKNREKRCTINAIEEIVLLKANKNNAEVSWEKAHSFETKKERKAWLNPDICD